MKRLILMLIPLIVHTNGDVSHILKEYSSTTPNPPPSPYEFEYSAGRFPGHIDRTHAEYSDGSGTVRGAFSYVDPRNQVRTVEYVADEYGFYPKLSHEQESPKESEAVKLATERHHALYNRIAAEHANPHAVVAHEPRNTVAVEKAKQKHLSLFEKIAAEHALLGAQREAERLAFEATSIRNDYEEQYLQK